MKKVFQIGIVIIIGLLFVGCSQSKDHLSCTQITDDETSKTTIVADVSFKENKIDKIIMKRTIVLKEDYFDFFDTFKEYHEDMKNAMNEEEGIIVTTEYLENTIIMNVESDVAKMEEETKEAMAVEDLGTNYQSALKYFKEEEYTCK